MIPNGQPGELDIVDETGSRLTTIRTGEKIISVNNAGNKAFVVSESSGRGNSLCRTMYDLPNGSGQPF